MKKKIKDLTLKQVYDFYNSDKCECHCSKDSYCPFHAGNCCLCDVVGFKTDSHIAELYKTQLGIDFNENLKVKDVIAILMNKEAEIK